MIKYNYIPTSGNIYIYIYIIKYIQLIAGNNHIYNHIYIT